MKNKFNNQIALVLTLTMNSCGTTENKDNTEKQVVYKSANCKVSEKNSKESVITCDDGAKFVIPHGKDGKDGKNGVNGKDGKVGQTGIQGEPGKEAPSCQVSKNLETGKVIVKCGNETTEFFEAKPLVESNTNITDVEFFSDNLTNSNSEARCKFKLSSQDLSITEKNIIVTLTNSDRKIVYSSPAIKIKQLAEQSKIKKLAPDQFEAEISPKYGWTQPEDQIYCSVNLENQPILPFYSKNSLMVQKSEDTLVPCEGDFQNVRNIPYDPQAIYVNENGFACQVITGNLNIANTKLTDLKKFSKIVQIDGEIRIEDNKYLATVSGFDNLQNFKNRYFLSNNRLLTSLAGINSNMFSSQARISILGGNLTNINDLECDQLGGLTITSVSNLLELKINIRHLDYLFIWMNDNLEKISHSATLQNIEYLRLSGNEQLKFIDGLKNINIADGHIQGSTLLDKTECESELFAPILRDYCKAL